MSGHSFNATFTVLTGLGQRFGVALLSSDSRGEAVYHGEAKPRKAGAARRRSIEDGQRTAGVFRRQPFWKQGFTPPASGPETFYFLHDIMRHFSFAPFLFHTPSLLLEPRPVPDREGPRSRQRISGFQNPVTDSCKCALVTAVCSTKTVLEYFASPFPDLTTRLQSPSHSRNDGSHGESQERSNPLHSCRRRHETCPR